MRGLRLSPNALLLQVWCAFMRVAGGQFFRGIVMKVERLDVCEFKLTLSSLDIKNIEDIAEYLTSSIERAIEFVCSFGIDRQIEDTLEKE